MIKVFIKKKKKFIRMTKTGVPVYFAVELEVTNIRSPSILFHKI